MTYSEKKSIYTWTQKHKEFVHKYRLGSVAQELWQWLQSLPTIHGKIEFRLQEFIDYTKKLRWKARTFSWAYGQFKKLVFLRIINIDKDFTHHEYRIELRHPDDIKPKKTGERNLHYHHVSLEKVPSNDCHSETSVSSSSNCSNSTSAVDSLDSGNGNEDNKHASKPSVVSNEELKRRLLIIRLCAKYGINFNPKKPTTAEIYKYPMEEITESLELFKRRNKHEMITNPQGFLIDCLRFKFYEDNAYTLEQVIADIAEVFSPILKNRE